jgi:hypothetical protein
MGRGGKAKGKAPRKATPSAGGTTRRWFLWWVVAGFTVLGWLDNVLSLVDRLHPVPVATLPPAPQALTPLTGSATLSLHAMGNITFDGMTSVATGIVGPSAPTLTV